jgi:hypothetical protein
MYHQDVRRRGRVGDLHEVLCKIEGEIGLQHAVDDIRRRPHEQRVAVLRGAHDLLRRHRAAAAGLVLDDELLAHGLGQSLRQYARGEIGSRARTETDDDSYCPRRVVALR